MPFTTTFFAPKTLSTRATTILSMPPLGKDIMQLVFIVLGEEAGQKVAKVRYTCIIFFKSLLHTFKICDYYLHCVLQVTQVGLQDFPVITQVNTAETTTI